MTPQDFIAKISPAAIASSKITGIPAGFTIAESALESGWGGSGLTLSANNLFGVKADTSWHGPVARLPTKEFFKGTEVIVSAMWRAYPDWQSSIEDHAKFLTGNPRYTPAFQVMHDAEEFTRKVASAGYATDPDYADKIIGIMHAHNLTELA